jgi:hypothetical protein
MADVDWRVVAVDKITAGKSIKDAIKTLVNPFGSLGEGKGKENQRGHTLNTNTHPTLPPSVSIHPQRFPKKEKTKIYKMKEQNKKLLIFVTGLGGN